MNMAFGESNLNNNSQFINCLRTPIQQRTNADVETIFCSLWGMQAVAGLPESAVRTMSETARYEARDSNYLLYMADDVASCWYILLSGCVFLECCMYLPGSSFGKQPLSSNGKRGTDCLVLEYSELIVIDFPNTELFQPFQRHSYSKTDLERLLALETRDYRIGGPIPDDEQLPMELQHVKEIILRSDQNMKKSASEDSSSINNYELDLTGLVESIVDSDEDDEEEEESHSSRESLMVRDVVRDCLEKEPSDRTPSDIQALLDFMQHLPAFANMTMNVRQELCAVMVFAVVDKAGSIVMENEEELDSWCVILNGSVEIVVHGEEPLTLHLGDSFGVEPTLKKMRHKGIMKTRVDDCQFVCVAQADYYRILTQGERSIQCIEEGGEVVMVTEFRKTDGGSRQGQVVIKATAQKLISHVVADHSAIDPTYVEDLLLTYKTFLDRPSEICSQLLNWFLEKRFRDKVTRAILLWVNNHYGDFESDPVMESYLETFEKGLEQQQMSGQLGLLNIACAAKAKSRRITMDRPSKDKPLGFTIAGGKESGFGIFVSKVEEDCKALEAGLRRGDQLLEVNGTNFENVTATKARDILSCAIHVSMLVKRNMPAFKEMEMTPHRKENLKITQSKDTVQRSSSDCSERQRTLQSRFSVPEISSDPSKKPIQHLHPSSTTERVKKALNRLSAIGTLSRNTKLISKSERDLLSVDQDGTDDLHMMAKHGVKKTRASLPRGFGSTECINTSDQSLEMPDGVIKVFKADQTCRYFMVYKETTTREVVNRAVEAFGIQDSPREYALCEVTVEDGGFVKQRRLPDMLANLPDRIHLNGRYYLKNNSVSSQLLPDEAAQELAKESQFSLLQLKPKEVAKELTLQDFEVFRSIDPREYIYKLWNFGPKLTENLRKFSEIVNNEMFWVVTEICSEPNLVKRMKLIKTFIKIARYCKECKNYNSLFAIVSGLGHSTVQRLKNTWDKLPTKHSKAFEDLQSLMDPSRNMSKYRNLLNGEHGEPPLIPFFPVITKDLTFIHLGNDSIVDGLVNFEKLRLIAREVRQISKFNSIPYDPDTMFEDEVNSQGGPGQQRVTSTVVGMVTGSSTWSRRSLRDQNPKKMYEESMMSRRVKQYLSNLTVIQDEENLREMSNVCEPPQGSAAAPSVQSRKKTSPTSSPGANKKDRKAGKPIPSPLALRKDIAGDRISVSSTASTSSLTDVQSPKQMSEEEIHVFPEVDRTSLPEDTVHMQELRRLHINDEHQRPHYRHPPVVEVVRPIMYTVPAPSADTVPYSPTHSTSSQEHPYHPEEEGQVSAV
ncbi:Rap guanine nucleotide exchange factor 6 [Stylophora pistillata]|uniref:Rap guanine nucleotide exchange factor 6 n=1 Tax=Stylophora pistillata TaxID=50429 RepID=A0A2B4SBJ2_STYPI|nr:Rap guanine nucleotide exchange factor 6 [Stylophora pistillata]